jgi:hypothetical protein
LDPVEKPTLANRSRDPDSARGAVTEQPSRPMQARDRRPSKPAVDDLRRPGMSRVRVILVPALLVVLALLLVACGGGGGGY